MIPHASFYDPTMVSKLMVQRRMFRWHVPLKENQWQCK